MSEADDKENGTTKSFLSSIFATFDLGTKHLESKKHIWLTFFSLFLFFGYLSWAIYAKGRGLPILSLINSQYLLAGFFSIFYCIILLGIFFIGGGVVSVSPRGGFLAVILLPAIWFFIWLALFLSMYWRDIDISTLDLSSAIENDGSLSITILALSFVLLAGGCFYKFLPLLIKQFSFLDEQSLTLSAVSLVVVFGLSIFPLVVMPIVPQQFGGARPLCAVFTLDRSKLDEELLEALGISSTAKLMPKEIQIGQGIAKPLLAARSKELSVVSIDDSRYILNLNDFSQGRYKSIWNAVEIPRNSILAISWCRAKGPYWISDNLLNMFGLPRDAETGS